VLGYTGTINLSVSGLPPSSSGGFDQPSVQIVDKRAVRATYTLTVSDTPDGTPYRRLTPSHVLFTLQAYAGAMRFLALAAGLLTLLVLVAPKGF
jgi:hypothetical protein